MEERVGEVLHRAVEAVTEGKELERGRKRIDRKIEKLTKFKKYKSRRQFVNRMIKRVPDDVIVSNQIHL